MNLPAEFHGATCLEGPARGVFIYTFKDAGYIEVRPSIRSIDVFFEDGVTVGDLKYSPERLTASLESAYKMLRGYILLKLRAMRDNIELYQRLEEHLQGYLQELADLDGKAPESLPFWCIVRGDGQVP